jgi:hypothetical protein
MDFRSLKTWGIGLLAGLGLAIASEAQATQMYDPTNGRADEIGITIDHTTNKILQQCAEHEHERLVTHDIQEFIHSQLPSFNRQMVPGTIEEACSAFTTSTTRQSLVDLNDFSSSLGLSISQVQEIRARAEATYSSTIWAQAYTRKQENQLFSKQRFIENKEALLKYQTLVSRLDRLQEHLESRPYDVQTQTTDIESRRQDLMTIFREFYGPSESFIGDEKEEMHYLSATRAKRFQQELIALSGEALTGVAILNSNNIRVLEQRIVQSERQYNRAQKDQAIQTENRFASTFVQNSGVLFLTEREREENLTQISSLLNQGKIHPVILPGELRIYRLDSTSEEEVKILAIEQGYLTGLKEETIAQLSNTPEKPLETRVEKPTPLQKEVIQTPTITPQQPRTPQREVIEITLTQPETNLTETRLLELIQSFAGKIYGSHIIQENNLQQIDLWAATAALGKMYGHDTMGSKANRALRYSLLNHEPNLQVLQEAGMGTSFTRYTPYEENNGKENRIALRAILDGKIALDLPDTTILKHIQTLAQKESLSAEELIQAQALLRTIENRGLENTLIAQQTIEEYSPFSGETYCSAHNPIFQELSPEQIQYNEEIGTTLTNYETRGAGSIDKVVEAINYTRDNNQVVSRFNKKALEASNDLGFAYNILADFTMTREERIEAIELSLGMSISNSHAKRMEKEADEYLQQCANEEALASLETNERVNPSELAEMVEAKAYESTRASPQTHSSLPNKRTQKAAA